MKDITWSACLRLGVTAAAVYLVCAGRETLAQVVGVLSPLLLGGGAACIVNIPMSALERRLFPRGGRLGRGVCLVISLAGVAAAAVWLAGVILPEMAQCALLLAGELPELLTSLACWLDQTDVALWLRSAGLPDGRTLLQTGLSMALTRADDLLSRAAETLSALTAGAANAVLALILAGYMLAGKERLRTQLTGLARQTLGDAPLRRIETVLTALHRAFCTYVQGQCIEALLLGGLCLLGMLLMHLPQALMISALAGASALIPLVGTPIAAAAGAVLLMPCGTGAAWKFTVFFLILQQVESNLLYPRIVGATLGLSPLWMLTAMLTGGGLFSLPGAVLAVPVAAATRALLMTR